jgi:hypothetical protein
MLHVSRNEATIALLESRGCLGRRNHRLIGMSGISSAAKLVSDKQIEYDK